MSLDNTIMEQITELLGTMGEALEYLSHKESKDLRGLVKDCRARVADALESGLPRPLELQINASKLSDEDWLRAVHLVMQEVAEPFQPKNAFDREFQALLDHIWSHSEGQLLQGMKENLKKIKGLSEETYQNFVNYFARFPLWGTIDPDKGDYQTLELRAAVLKRHSYDFLWLYQRMGDYLSKRTLFAILENWCLLNMSELQKVKSIFPDYWEPDIFPDNQGDVLVDVGAYIGDSIAQYINVYGQGYEKIYAYEISAGSYAQLCKNIQGAKLHNIIPQRKEIGSVRDKMFVDAGDDASANRLRKQGGGPGHGRACPFG